VRQVRIGPNECAGWCTTGLSDGAGSWVLPPLPNNDQPYMIITIVIIIIIIITHLMFLCPDCRWISGLIGACR
jgi:hypothetical protein